MTNEIFLETVQTTAKKHRPNVQFDKLPRDKDHPYTMISNDESSFAQDDGLTAAAYGLMCKVQSLFKNWHFSIAGFSTLFKDGEDKISSLLDELEENNYLIRKRIRDKLGRYESFSYHFFESSKECLAYKKEHEEELAEVEAVEKSVKTKSKKTAKTTETVPEVVTFTEQTRQVQSPGETPDKITAILEENIITVTQEFAIKTASYLISAVNKGIITLDAVTDKLNAIINKQQSLDVFLHKLKETCTNALKKLKNPNAKYRFIRKTMVNILNEYDPDSTEPVPQSAQIMPSAQTIPSTQTMPSAQTIPSAQQSKKQTNIHPQENTMPPTLSFRDLLLKIHCFMVLRFENNEEYYGISLDSAEKFWASPNLDPDEYEHELRACYIEEDLRHNPENMENALKFLMGWDTLEASEFKSFSNYAISCLAEVLQTAHCCGEFVNYHQLIKNLNCINSGGENDYERHTNEDSIYLFMKSFFDYYCNKIEQYPPRTNKKGYITRMLVNYLNGEYQAYHAHVHASFKNLKRNFTVERSHSDDP